MGLVYSFPASTENGKGGVFIPKERIYKDGRVKAAVQELFVHEVKRITWTHKLTPTTLSLPATDLVRELHIFTVDLHSQHVSPEVVMAMDKVIGHQIIYQLRHNSQVSYMATYKRPSKLSGATASSVVVAGKYFSSLWASVAATNARPLPSAHNLAMLYEELLKSLLPISTRQGETFEEAQNRLARVEKLERNIVALSNKIAREKQYHIQVKHHREIGKAKEEIEDLLSM